MTELYPVYLQAMKNIAKISAATIRALESGTLISPKIVQDLQVKKKRKRKKKVQQQQEQITVLQEAVQKGRGEALASSARKASRGAEVLPAVPPAAAARRRKVAAPVFAVDAPIQPPPDDPCFAPSSIDHLFRVSGQALQLEVRAKILNTKDKHPFLRAIDVVVASADKRGAFMSNFVSCPIIFRYRMITSPRSKKSDNGTSNLFCKLGK